MLSDNHPELEIFLFETLLEITFGFCRKSNADGKYVGSDSPPKLKILYFLMLLAITCSFAKRMKCRQKRREQG